MRSGLHRPAEISARLPNCWHLSHLLLGSPSLHPEADLIVLDGNPLENINSVRDVLLVVNDGKVAVNHLNF